MNLNTGWHGQLPVGQGVTRHTRHDGFGRRCNLFKDGLTLSTFVIISWNCTLLMVRYVSYRHPTLVMYGVDNRSQFNGVRACHSGVRCPWMVRSPVVLICKIIELKSPAKASMSLVLDRTRVPEPTRPASGESTPVVSMTSVPEPVRAASGASTPVVASTSVPAPTRAASGTITPVLLITSVPDPIKPASGAITPLVEITSVPDPTRPASGAITPVVLITKVPEPTSAVSGAITPAVLITNTAEPIRNSSVPPPAAGFSNNKGK